MRIQTDPDWDGTTTEQTIIHKGLHLKSAILYSLKY